MHLYCRSLGQTKRFITREVMVGKVGVGGDNPIRIQSMTTTDTMDTKLTIDQSMRMIDKFRDREDWRERSRNDFDISMIIIQEDGDWVTCYFQLIPIADFINSR